ncbi:MAG: M24 family metallopeptidase, partial [Candidatus Hodarchaeota archaeon]
GKFSEDARSKLDALIQVKNHLIDRLGPGVSLGELYAEVVEISKELGIYDEFMGEGEDKVVFIGHGVGLELDELPIFYPKGPQLESGNVLACEPKVIVPGEEVLGIEDTYAITATGNTVLSKAPNIFEIGP